MTQRPPPHPSSVVATAGVVLLSLVGLACATAPSRTSGADESVMPQKLPSHYDESDEAKSEDDKHGVARQEGLSPRSLLVRAEVAPPAPPTLSPEAVRHDVELLRYALENGYGGRNHIDAGAFASALSALDALATDEQARSPRALCDAIARILALLPDNHLEARSSGDACGRRERRPKGRVGENAGSGRDRPWLVEQHRHHGRSYVLVAITALPPHQDPVWEGFLKAVEDALASSEALVLDLRGNGGGDDTTGRRLAALLWGGPTPKRVSVLKSTTPATFALAANGVRLAIRTRRAHGDPVPAYYEQKLKRHLDDLDDARKGRFPEETVVPAIEGVPFDPVRGYDKPVFVLIDRGCGSSCESTLEWLENHPKLETIGENTAGYVHFGNMGHAVLPTSQIVVQLATDFWRFDDGRWVEKTGYAPDVPVEPDRDALTVVLARMMAKARPSRR